MSQAVLLENDARLKATRLEAAEQELAAERTKRKEETRDLEQQLEQVGVGTAGRLGEGGCRACAVTNTEYVGGSVSGVRCLTGASWSCDVHVICRVSNASIS